MNLAWHLGNDIIDLADPRHVGKAGDHRFLKRVFSTGEQTAIQSAPDPNRVLWVGWAGKEAAFKTVSKALGTPPTFAHILFEVEGVPENGWPVPHADADGTPVSWYGRVRYQELTLPLHALTWMPTRPGEYPPFSWGFQEFFPRPGDWRQELKGEFSTKEWSCVTHQASALARLAARSAMAEELGIPQGELEIVCGPGRPGQRIPRVLRGGEDAGLDLTLSHHGRLLAWAFLTK